MARIALGLLCGLLSGCSFVAVNGPPSAPEPGAERREPKCTTSDLAPIIDTVVAGFQGVRTVVALSADDAAYEEAPISREVDIALGVAFTSLFTASAIYGFSTTSSCEDAKEEFRSETARAKWHPPTGARPAPPAHPGAPVAPAGPALPPPPACTFDAECVDARICERHQCTQYDPKR